MFNHSEFDPVAHRACRALIESAAARQHLLNAGADPYLIFADPVERTLAALADRAADEFIRAFPETERKLPEILTRLHFELATLGERWTEHTFRILRELRGTSRRSVCALRFTESTRSRGESKASRALGTT